MLNRLSKLREKRAEGERGFTLIELLVVVVILGILIAIAIPLYLNYRQGANDASAKSDVRNAINAFEQCNTDGGNYPTAVTQSGGVTGCGSTANVNISSGTQLTYFPSTATTPTNYLIMAKNTSGSGKVYCYASATGGSVKPLGGTAPIAYAGVCP